jgi:uncharacterized protein (TIRG00374 family)
VSILLLWWALHDVSLSEVWHNLRGARILPLLGMVVVATARFPLITVRWRYLLRIEGESIPFVPLWHATAIGFMANNLLPARAGEFARAYAARQVAGVRFSTAFASIAVERIMDGITLVAILSIGIWAGGFAPGTAVAGLTLGEIARSAGLLFGVALVMALLVVHWPAPTRRMASAVASRMLPQQWAEKVVGFIDGLLTGLDALKSPKRSAAVILWSFAVWGVTTASFWLGFYAFGIQVPWAAALVLQGIIGFGVAVPSSPGFVGTFEAATRIGLVLYAVEASDAVSYALGYHITTFLPITLLGIWSLSRVSMRLGDLRNGAEGADTGQGGQA